MSTKFVTRRDIDEAKRAELFMALDNTDAHCATFKALCGDVSRDVVCKARDVRPNWRGRTLLHNASRDGKLPAVVYLLNIGHEVDAIDSCVSLITPIMDAILLHRTEIAILLAKAGASFAKQDMSGENVFHCMARAGNCRMLLSLIEAAGISMEDVRDLASVTNVRLKFPEDVAANSMIRQVLIQLREQGYYKKIQKKRK
jgi:ankyrin repeat protein